VFIALILAFLAGAIAATLILLAVARAQMIQVARSPLRFDETVSALEDGAMAAEGWSSPGTRDMNAMMAKHGVDFRPRVKLVEMCKAPYAAEVLRDDRKIATLMPCAVAVYEDDQGQVWYSKMNVGLMARLFGGTVGRVMGLGVAREERQILANLHRAG
jgi:uncharacterized protein (DUF302 family)